MATKDATSSRVDLILKCLILVAQGFLFFTEKPFYQEMIMERGWSAVDRFRNNDYDKNIRKKIRYLKYRDFVKEKRIGSDILLVLTEKGETRLLQEKIKFSRELKRNRQIRVEYDFPKGQDSARDNFRRFLKRSGFRMFQKSIWVTEKDVYKLMKKFIINNQINEWVDVIECRVSKK